MCRSNNTRRFYDSVKNGKNKKEYNAERPLQDNNKEKKAFVPQLFPVPLLPRRDSALGLTPNRIKNIAYYYEQVSTVRNISKALKSPNRYKINENCSNYCLAISNLFKCIKCTNSYNARINEKQRG